MWKTIPNFNGIYEVNSKGEVRRLFHNGRIKLLKGYLIGPNKWYCLTILAISQKLPQHLLTNKDFLLGKLSTRSEKSFTEKLSKKIKTLKKNYIEKIKYLNSLEKVA